MKAKNKRKSLKETYLREIESGNMSEAANLVGMLARELGDIDLEELEVLRREYYEDEWGADNLREFQSSKHLDNLVASLKMALSIAKQIKSL
jgi:type IV secretory pathway VirD2 relaxase